MTIDVTQKSGSLVMTGFVKMEQPSILDNVLLLGWLFKVGGNDHEKHMLNIGLLILRSLQMTLKYCIPPLAGMSVSDTPKGVNSVTALANDRNKKGYP